MLDVGPREAIWLQFWAAIRAHPWFGYGFGQGVLALREVAAQMPPGRNTTYAHSVVLDLMAWFGIPLALGLVVGMGAWMRTWLRRSENVAQDRERHWVFAFWLALAAQSLLEFPYAHTFFLLPAALLAGVITSVPNDASGSDPKFHAKPSIPALALAALCTGLLLLLCGITFNSRKSSGSTVLNELALREPKSMSRAAGRRCSTNWRH